MLAIKHILFPLDFSDRCCAAVPFVEAMASRFGSRITLLSAAQPVYYAGMGDPAGAMMFNTDELLNELSARLSGALVKEFAHLSVERIAELGDPAQAIVDYAVQVAAAHNAESDGKKRKVLRAALKPIDDARKAAAPAAKTAAASTAAAATNGSATPS